jgi:signal recognition particle receptor subunit beta
MSNAYKVIVTGPFNSGKTTFVRAASDIEVVMTEKRLTTEDRGIKAETTIAMDYGRADIDGNTMHLYGTPGQARFSFMWEILAHEMDSFVVLIDGTDRPALPDAAQLISVFSGFQTVPYLIASNKSDLPGQLTPEAIRAGTGARPEIPILMCSATDRESVRTVLNRLITLMQRSHPQA